MRDEMADLYHASYRRLVAQVYAFTTDLNEAQDAVSEAFARAIARRGHLSDIDAPEAWLRTVAVNIVKRKWRRRQLLDRIMLRERPVTRFIEDAPEPERTDLREALSTIPRAYREVIVLHYLADLPVDEVAAILEVPVGTVKSRLSRGREALKGLLDDVEAPPLSQVERRAGTIKARRRVAQATVAAAVMIASAVIFLPFGRSGTVQPAESASPSPSPMVITKRDGGITVLSPPDVSTVPDLPGAIVEFNVDGDDVLRTDAGVWARSRDGGQTWEIIEDYQRRKTAPWGGSRPENSWFAKRPTPDGTWWMAGKRDGHPTLSFSRDGGANWQTIDLPAGGDGLTATLVGNQVFVLTLQGKLILSGYVVEPGGFRKLSDGDGRTGINGEPVVLADGRTLAAGADGDFIVSTNRGATWTALKELPVVGSLQHTSGGFAALNVYGGGWVATSADGLIWQKLPIR